MYYCRSKIGSVYGIIWKCNGALDVSLGQKNRYGRYGKYSKNLYSKILILKRKITKLC